MIKRALLFIIVVGSIGWLSFVAFDILSEKSNYDETTLFGSQDGTLFIVNRGNEVQSSENLGLTNPVLAPVVDGILDSQFETAYISGSRNQMLIKKSTNWDNASVELLLSGIQEQITFNSGNFNAGQLSGRFYKKSLYLSDGTSYESNKSSIELIYDKKASASQIEFGENNQIETVTDLYFLPGNKTNYITHNQGIGQGNQVKDQVLFSHVISSKAKNYHFLERDYYASQDSIFANSPMFNWMQSGFVEVSLNGKTALISDYLDGQDPILILNDLNQSLDTNRFSNRLTSRFPQEGKSYFIKYLDDLVVLSEDENTCNALIADFKLGNTVSLNKNAQDQIFSNLPKAVSERYIGQDSQYSKAVYQGRILETQLGTKIAVVKNNNKETISYNCEFDIIDFTTYNKGESVVALGKNGEIKSFKSGKEVWKTQLDEKAIGAIQTIDLHDNKKFYTLVNTATKIYLFDETGKNASGFPINIDSELTNEVKFYRWKGNSYFIAANAEKEIMHFDSKGRELSIFKTDIIVSRKIDVWASNRILFAGLANDNNFRMINLDKYKKHREFGLPSNCIATKIPNELIQFGFDGSTLFKIDQRGTRHNFSKFNQGKLKNVFSNSKNPIVVVQDGNEIILLNTNGVPFASFKVPYNEIDNIFVTKSEPNKTIVGIIDGLENNVYFYTTEGKRIIQKPLEGQTKVTLSALDNEYIITTVMDQFIVQYFEN